MNSRLALVLLLLSSCSDRIEKARSRDEPPANRSIGPEKAGSSANNSNATVALPEKIGVISMSEKGTIKLMLRTEDEHGIWEAQYIYEKSNKDYEKTLNEYGPLRPGESKIVYSRPE